MLTILSVQFTFLWLRNIGYVALCSIWSTCNLAPIWRDALSRLIDKWLTGSTVRTWLSVETNACVRCPCSSLTVRGFAVPYNPQVESEALWCLGVTDVTRHNVSPVYGCASLSKCLRFVCLLYCSLRENIGWLFVLHLLQNILIVQEVRCIIGFSLWRLHEDR